MTKVKAKGQDGRRLGFIKEDAEAPQKD